MVFGPFLDFYTGFTKCDGIRKEFDKKKLEQKKFEIEYEIKLLKEEKKFYQNDQEVDDDDDDDDEN